MKLKFVFSVTALFLGVAVCVACMKPAPAGKEPSSTPVRHAEAREAAGLVASNAVIVLDVRTPREFDGGHIAGATNINALSEDFGEKLAGLDRSQCYLIHCATGRRSTNALPQLTRLGFTNLIHLDGGIRAWQAAGNPVAKP